MGDYSVFESTHAHLERNGHLDTVLGSCVLTLARRLDAAIDPGAGLAAVAKELRLALEILDRVPTETADPVDQLRVAREKRQRGA